MLLTFYSSTRKHSSRDSQSSTALRAFRRRLSFMNLVERVGYEGAGTIAALNFYEGQVNLAFGC